MKILSAEFVRSCVRADHFPGDRLPELACAGRSNVGKSSLINSLLQRRGLAKVSGTPGKTRVLNFFRVTTSDPGAKSFYLVDLPGYGYAKVSASIRAQWGPMIEQYLAGRSALRGILLLIDARHVQNQDRRAVEWIRELGCPCILVATKADKLSRNARAKQFAAIRRDLGVPDQVPCVAYSSVTHEGRETLWGVMRDVLAEAGGRSIRT